jgi:hypothetical protein
MPEPAPGKRKLWLWAKGALTLSGIALACVLFRFSPKSRQVDPAAPAREVVAALASAGGMVLVQNPGRAEWREVKAGAQLAEGDLVRTDASGEAAIRYKNGAMVQVPARTVFTVRSGAGDAMEVSLDPDAALLSPLRARENGAASDATAGPMLELQRIVPFGRSLELIGRVEAGSSLMINNELVEVTGEGVFKHFTSPFPTAATRVQLTLKVTNLAGQARAWTASHDFGGNN